MLETTTRVETCQGVHLYLLTSQEKTLRAALQAAAAVEREPRTLRLVAQPGALEAAAPEVLASAPEGAVGGLARPDPPEATATEARASSHEVMADGQALRKKPR